MEVLFLEVLTANSCLGRDLVHNKVSTETCCIDNKYERLIGIHYQWNDFIQKKNNTNLEIWANISPDLSNPLFPSLLLIGDTVK